MTTYEHVFKCKYIAMKPVRNPLTFSVSDSLITELADLFSLLGDPSRLRIIIVCLHQQISVSDIAERLGLSQSLVSHHLRLLRAARMVRSERRGKQIFYTAADEHVQCVIEDMATHLAEPHSEEY
jgi:DNA-binding transcriptional ArsR family regulator